MAKLLDDKTVFSQLMLCHTRKEKILENSGESVQNSNLFKKFGPKIVDQIEAKQQIKVIIIITNRA